jgi:hypothetical protein
MVKDIANISNSVLSSILEREAFLKKLTEFIITAVIITYLLPY